MGTAVRQDPPGAALDASARAAVTIDRPADDLRTLWLDPRTQARIWAHFAEVTALDDGTADWIARARRSLSDCRRSCRHRRRGLLASRQLSGGDADP